MMDEDISKIENLNGNLIEKPQMPSYLQFDTLNILKKENGKITDIKKEQPKNFKLFASLLYSAFLSAGSILWFMLLALFLSKFRRKISVPVLNWIIRGMGILLCIISVSFAFSAVKMLI
jgi:hypothetical protein